MQSMFMKDESRSPFNGHEGIKTLGELKRSGYKPVAVKDEIRKNLLKRFAAKKTRSPAS